MSEIQGNVIQIKRGNGDPGDKLAPYELGYDTSGGYLYVGQNSASAKKIKAGFADLAEKITDTNGNPKTVGSDTEPIYLSKGEFVRCGGNATISGTIEYAKSLQPGATIVANLETNNPTLFDGSQNVTVGVSGTLPISKGGTGATTRLKAAKNLTDEEVIEPGYVVGLTKSWESFGYTSINNLRAILMEMPREKLQQDGEYAINMNNSDIIGLNAIYLSDSANSPREGILFPIDGSTNFDGIRAHDGEIKFSTGIDVSTGNATKTYTVLHSGNHSHVYSDLASGKTLNDKNSSFTINDVSGYTAFLFYGIPSGEECNVTMVIPRAMLSTAAKKFQLGGTGDAKNFSVAIDSNNKMTVANVGAVSGGLSAGTLGVYGIK